MNPINIIANVSQTGDVVSGGKRLVANVGGSSIPTSVAAFTSSNYNYMFSGLLPATPDLPDSTTLAYFYRDMYMHDNTAGSCVDIQSIFPFSDWELRGQNEQTLEVFNRALDRLNLRELLPQLSVAYLTDGFYTGSLIYDPKHKNFMDILTHDALQCAMSPSPFNNVDPTIQVSVSGPTSRFLSSTTEYARKYVQSMPASFVNLLKQGRFVLDPLTTLFVGRRSLTDRAYLSYLHRILPMYLIEKTMYRGTLTEAQRRQRAMSHVTAGDDIWTPTAEELMLLVQQFQTAENDPLGGWITTRNAVQIQDIRPGGDFWKWQDVVDVMVPYKLRALGISEALLSGDASYASAESAYSVFLESVNGYRTHLTNAIFYKKIFPLIAVANDLVKDKKVMNVTDFLFNMNDRANLKTPVLHWQKDLSAKAEDNMMDLLEKLSDKGIPVPLKTWLAATGIDKDSLIRDAKEDKEIKAELARLGLPVGTPEGQGEPGLGEDTDEDEFNVPEDNAPEKPESGQVTSASVHMNLHRTRKALLNREFGAHELVAKTRTGKPKHVYGQAAKIKDQNWKIAKIALKAETDPNYKEGLRKANLKKFGTDRMNNF